MSQNAVKRPDSGLPEIMPEGESKFENGQDVIEQLATMPEDTRHSRRRTVMLLFDPNGISQWSAFGWWTGTRNCCRD